MSYKTILVHSDADKAASARVDLAVALAQRFEAHLAGLFARPPFQMPAFSDGGFAAAQFMEAYEKSVQMDRATAQDIFTKAVRVAHVANEWRSADGDMSDVLGREARFADLVVLSQVDRRDLTPIDGDLPERVAIACGRPVLVVPRIGIARPPGKKVLLCWNARRESARAATDALPFLRAADQVTLLVVDARPGRQGHGAEPGADAAAWLARHGVKVTVQRDTAADSDVGNIILSRAADADIDLIVMGVYGHSRTRELVLGGVSRTILASMTVPVLMSH